MLIEQTLGEFMYRYPGGYNAEKISILVYSPASLENNFRVRYCIGAIDSKDSAAFLQEKDIVEISREEANSLCSSWKPSILKVMNEDLVISITAKLKKGIPLTQKEIKALDPNDDETLGLNYSRKLNIDDYINEIN